MNTNSNLSWLDADNLKALASAAGLSTLAPPRGAGVAAFRRAESGVGRAPAPAAPSLRQKLGASVLPGAAPSEDELRPAGLPPFDPPHAAAMGQRLNAFIDWLFRNLPCRRVFIADSDGLPLAQRHSNIDLIGISTVLMDASKQLRSHLQLPQEGSIGLELGGNETFQLLQLQMPWQEVSLGIIIRGSLARELVEPVKTALRSALELEPEPGKFSPEVSHAATGEAVPPEEMQAVPNREMPFADVSASPQDAASPAAVVSPGVHSPRPTQVRMIAPSASPEDELDLEFPAEDPHSPSAG